MKPAKKLKIPPNGKVVAAPGKLFAFIGWRGKPAAVKRARRGRRAKCDT
jgi:hypothetical protein